MFSQKELTLALPIQMEDPFPLTPALSPRERETISGAANKSPSRKHSHSAEKLFPLLWGEGQSEGEFHGQLHRCGLEAFNYA
jgi:hypothetical protein